MSHTNNDIIVPKLRKAKMTDTPTLPMLSTREKLVYLDKKECKWMEYNNNFFRNARYEVNSWSIVFNAKPEVWSKR